MAVFGFAYSRKAHVTKLTLKFASDIPNAFKRLIFVLASQKTAVIAVFCRFVNYLGGYMAQKRMSYEI